MILVDSAKKYYKGNMHVHTTVSDGKKSYDECLSVYQTLGYDFLAVTDHWKLNKESRTGDMLVLRGTEYDFDVPGQALHIVAVFPDGAEPGVARGDDPDEAIARINDAGGAAILAHPAWSMNTMEVMLKLGDVCGAEVFNAVSGFPWGNDRAHSGTQLDICANHGRLFGFAAGDDTHHYAGEPGSGFTMVCAEELTAEAIIGALKRGEYYASQGPEIKRAELDEGAGIYRVECSPVSRIAFYSNLPWSPGRCLNGEGMTEGEYRLGPEKGERWVRCEVIDGMGRRAWVSPARI